MSFLYVNLNIFNTRNQFVYCNASRKRNASVNSSCARPPPPPPGYCGAFALLFSPGGGEFANFAPPRGRAFANHGAIPELLTRTRFPFRIQLHRGYYWKKSTLAHLLRTGGCEACSRFYACISSLPIKPELHSETRELGITKHNRSRSSASW